MGNSSIITLYHGTVYDFNTIDVSRGRPNKDFGCGFYTSRSEQHAINLAVRNKEILKERNELRGKKENVTAWLYIYEFDVLELEKLNVKEFTVPDREWMQFVVANRTSGKRQHEYDIVIGATANDNTRVSIQTVLSAAGGQILTERAIDALIALVEPSNLPPQYFFGSQKAADSLRFMSRRIIR